jgi:multidrug efflux pump subunit AcrA (membrane-fusion protein)
VPTSASKPAVVIEEAAIGTDQSQKFVLTLTSSNTVAYRAIQLGTSVGGKRVVREGLKEGESVVVNGLVRVQPGMPVQPEKRTTVKR